MTEQPKSRQMEIAHCEEGWTIIHLANKDIIKMKIVVGAVHQILDEKGQPKRLPDNSGHLYGVSNQLVVFIEEPANKKEMN